MKLPSHKSALAVGLFLTASALFAQSTLTQWTFEGDVTTPSIGLGTASLVGTTTATFAAGNLGGRGWNTSTYAAQSTGSGTAGVQFSASTVGFENISLAYDHRASGTSSRWSELQYTTNGTTWTTFSNNAGSLSPHDTFYTVNVNLSSVPALNDNPNAGFRILSIFSQQAFDQNNTLSSFGANVAYMRANSAAVYSPSTSSATGDYAPGGTWRFDNVTITGTAIPEPSTSAALLGLFAIGAAALRRRSRA